MRKVIMGLAVSLDGYIEGPNGEYDWCFTDQDYGMSEFFQDIDTIFIGRKSYEVLGNAGSSENPFGHFEHYIFSNTMQHAPAGHHLVHGEISSQVRQLKNESGKNIWLFGGAALIASLMKEHLVDELWLSIHPILLGSGKSLFQGLSDRISLELIETKSYSTGLLSVKYKVN